MAHLPRHQLRLMDQIVDHPRGYVFRDGSDRLREETSVRRAVDLMYRFPGSGYSVLMETPLDEVYLQLDGEGVSVPLQGHDYEFCTIESGRLVPFLPAMQGPERTRVLLAFCELAMRRIARGGRPENAILLGAIPELDVELRQDVLSGWAAARKRLQGAASSRLLGTLVPALSTTHPA